MTEQTEHQIGEGALRLSDDAMQMLLHGEEQTLQEDAKLDEVLGGLTEHQRQVLILRVADIAGDRTFWALDAARTEINKVLSEYGIPHEDMEDDLAHRLEEVQWKYAGER